MTNVPGRRGGTFFQTRRLVLAAVLGAALLTAGCYNSYIPKAADVPGKWCSPDGDVLTLAADGKFEVTSLSRAFTEYLLPAEGYVDDYRINTELGGKVPSTASGTWKTHLVGGDPTDAHDNSVMLTLEKVGTHRETGVVALYFDGGSKESWGFATLPESDFIRFFDRCATDPKNSAKPL